MKNNTPNIFMEVAGVSVGWSIVMIILGFLAVVLPLATGTAISVLVAWIIVLGGLTYFASAFAGRNARAFIWRMLIGIVYVAGGTYLGFHPQLALASLTVVLAVIFFMKGALEMARYFQHRAHSGSGWILFDAIVSLLLAGLIGLPWPSSSAWAIGTILGINLIFSGFTLLMYSLAARRTLEALC